MAMTLRLHGRLLLEHEFLQMFYGVVQGLMVLAASSLFKMAADVRKLKRDLNAAWKIIRQLEKKENENGI